MIATSGWMRHVAGGWTVNGITTLQKGAPLVKLRVARCHRPKLTCFPEGHLPASIPLTPPTEALTLSLLLELYA
jgi:hypothetical protein